MRVETEFSFLIAVALSCAASTQVGSSSVPANVEVGAPLVAERYQRVAQQVPTLRRSRDELMQRALLEALEDLQLSVAVERGQLGVALVDITDPRHPRLAAVNDDIMFYAASLPKIAILLGAFQRAEEGSFLLDDDTIAQLTRMIRYSSNPDATTIFNRVGADYLAALLQSDRYRLYDSNHGGGLWVGKEYAETGVWRRDPLNDISHGATAYEVARFYYLLETGRLVSPEACRRMKEILSRPAIKHKFVSGLERMRPGSIIYRKSGSWKQFHSDSAIVERDGRRYIAVALANHPNGGEWLSHLIVSLDDIVFSQANITVSLTDKGLLSDTR